MKNMIVMLTELFILYVQKDFCDKTFRHREVRPGIPLLVWTFFYSSTNLLTYLFDMPFWFRFPVFAIPFMIVLHILYEGVFEVRLAVASFIYIMGMLAEAIVCFAGAVLGFTIGTALETTELYLIYNILFKLIWFMEIKIAFVLQKKNRMAGIKKTDWVEVFFVPVSSIFIIVSIFEPYAESYFILKLTASFLLLVINLFTYHSYYSIQEKTFSIAEKKFLTQQIESYAVQLQTMGQLWEQMRMSRHETQQKNLLVQSYIEQKKYEKIKEIYGEPREIPESRPCISNTGNYSMDALINYKASVAEKYGIRIILDAVVPYNADFEDIALYSLLGNLLDNAIEAVKEITPEDRYIRLQIRTTNNLYVQMENPYSGELRKKNGQYLTTKPNREEHGLGLKMVRDIVEKYHGILEIKDGSNKFSVVLFVYDIARTAGRPFNP